MSLWCYAKNAASKSRGRKILRSWVNKKGLIREIVAEKFSDQISVEKKFATPWMKKERKISGNITASQSINQSINHQLTKKQDANQSIKRLKAVEILQ